MKLRSFIFPLVLFGAILCPTQNCFITIIPGADPKTGYYVMKVGSSVVFQVNAFIKSDTGNNQTALEQQAWWDYNKRLLEKTAGTPESITLRAIKPGISKLTVGTTIKNVPFTQEVDILISQ